MGVADTTAEDVSTSPDEAELRSRLYQLDCAMDEARRNPEKGDFFALAAEREEVLSDLRALDPPEASLGDQHNPEHVRGEPEVRPPIPSPWESGGAAI